MFLALTCNCYPLQLPEESLLLVMGLFGFIQEVGGYYILTTYEE